MTTAVPVVIVASCALLLAYVFVGYPYTLRAIVALRGARAVRREAITPRVTLVVSAFNEADVIREKLENALALDYPPDLLDIVVISDASADGTDEVVLAVGSPRVSLRRQDERRGKTAGLNREVPALKGDIVVFSDANAMYKADAIRCLVRNFADPEVGCVTGEARYVEGSGAAADVGEVVYWDYEMHLKRLESAVGSMVGGDGAIYAIRKELWQTLPENAINDFLNPLQIVAAGWRNVYEPEAVAFEETAGEVRREYKRRVRIVSRSWRAVFQARGVLDPRRVGLFTFCLISHKVMRWLAPAILILGAVAAVPLVLHLLGVEPWWVAPVVVAACGVLLLTPPGRKLAGVAGYFLVIGAASLVGVVKGTFGRVSGVWTPPREGTHEPSAALVAPPVRTSVPRTSTFLSALGWLVIALAVLQMAAARYELVGVALLIASVAGLAYIYAGYPLLMGAYASLAGSPVVRNRDLRPSVSIVIAAYNEASVIADKVQNALDQKYPPELLEVIVVSDGSTDGTDQLVSANPDPRLRLFSRTERAGKISAVNFGVSKARHDIVVLTDANAFLASDAVRMLVSSFADEHVGCVSGDVVLTGDRAALGVSEDLYYGYERWLQKVESDVWTMVGVDGALYAIRRAGFVPQPADTILDDMAIPYTFVRGGRRIVFEPGARAVEAGSITAREEFGRKIRVVAGAVQFLARVQGWCRLPPQFVFSLISHKALRWLTPLFLLSLLCSSVLLLRHPLGFIALGVQLAFYTVGVLGLAPGVRRLRLVGLAHYFCLVQVGAAAGLVRGALNRQSVRWERFGRGPVKRQSVTGEPVR